MQLPSIYDLGQTSVPILLLVVIPILSTVPKVSADQVSIQRNEKHYNAPLQRKEELERG